MSETFARWHVDVATVREWIHRAGNPRERERWHALWLLALGWSAAQVAEALGRDPHTVGAWLHTFEQGGPPGMVFEQTSAPPRPDRRPASGAGWRVGEYAAGGRDRVRELDLEGAVRVYLR